MKLLLMLTSLLCTAACRAEMSSYPNDTFVIPDLTTTTYTTNRRKGMRSHHMWFTLIDNSISPRNATCDVKWETTEPAPSNPIACMDSWGILEFSIKDFTDIKDFNLEISRVIGPSCPTHCVSSEQLLPWASQGYANITRDGMKWKHTRTTSGSTVSAIVDEPVIMAIEYMNMCDGHIDEHDEAGDKCVSWADGDGVMSVSRYFTA